MSSSDAEKKIVEEMSSAEAQRQPVLMFFHAQWCGACQHTKQNLMENIRKLSAANGVKVIEADVDEAPKMSNAVKVKAMPTFQMWKPDSAGNLSLDEKKDVVVGADAAAVEKLVTKAK